MGSLQIFRNLFRGSTRSSSGVYSIEKSEKQAQTKSDKEEAERTLSHEQKPLTAIGFVYIHGPSASTHSRLQDTGENPQNTFQKINSILAKGAIYLIRFYQKFISPGLPHSCRFYPTCSEYSIQAISKYGILKGGIMSLWRILRCNPFNPGGYDPVK